MESAVGAAGEAADQAQDGRRRSGRVVKPPRHLSPSAADRKRKRSSCLQDVPDLISDNDNDSDNQSQEAEATQKRRRSNQSKADQITATLPVRSAPKSSNKSGKRPFGDENNLFEIISSSLLSNDDAARGWLREFEKDQTNALVLLINVLLRCAGCELKINRYDIEDPDNAANKVGDLQEEYQAQNITDYPLVAKGGSGNTFKQQLGSFFDILVKKLAESQILYNDPKVLENIWVWMGSMSSSSNRAFRHTATVTSLSVISSLCDLARDLINTRARVLRQIEGEAKKKKPNQNRIKDLNATAQSAAESLDQINTITNDWFDALYLQRYRDTMPALRVDCALHLTNWIMTHPDQFFDGSHLRYLGWTLADQDKSVRLTVLKQLQIIYKDENKTAGLHHFTERFRPRMVEMATRDVDNNIRAAAVELLTILRDAGLVEPSDVDIVGKLIYDSEPQVRKKVAPFLVASVEEIYSAYVDELGGEDSITEVLPQPNEKDFDSIRDDWLKFKGLAELLVSFDPARQEIPNASPSARELLAPAPAESESRVCLATEAIHHLVPYLHRWEYLAGYLLADHSQSKRSGSLESRFREICALSDKEEIVLLDVLYASLDASLEDEDSEKKDRKGRKTVKELQLRRERYEETSLHLAAFIPKLLNKFEASAEAATAVLRLTQLLDLDVFQETGEDSNALAILLRDIVDQYETHESVAVLVQAAAALHHAQDFEDFEELVADKITSLWDGVIHKLLSHCQSQKNLTVRGNLKANVLKDLSKTLLQISILSRMFNCTEIFEDSRTFIPIPSFRKDSGGPQIVPMDKLRELLARAGDGSRVSPEIAAIESELALDVMQCILNCFLWHAHEIQSARTSSELSESLDEDDLTRLAENRHSIADLLHSIISGRHRSDPVRVAAAKLLLDLHIVFINRIGDAGSEAMQKLADQEMDTDWQPDIVKVFSALETDFAKKSNRKLESPDDNDDPEDLSDEEVEESSSSSEEDAEPPNEADEETTQRRQARASKKKKEELMAEHNLCDFTGKVIRGIIAGVIDRAPERSTTGVDGTPTASARRRADGEHQGPVRQRLAKNRTRLGPNFKALMDLLDRNGLPPASAQRGVKNDAAPKAATKSKSNAKKQSLHENADADEDDENQDVQMEDDIVDDEGGVEGEDENDDAGPMNGQTRASSPAESLLGD